MMDKPLTVLGKRTVGLLALTVIIPGCAVVLGLLGVVWGLLGVSLAACAILGAAFFAWIIVKAVAEIIVYGLAALGPYWGTLLAVLAMIVLTTWFGPWLNGGLPL